MNVNIDPLAYKQWLKIDINKRPYIKRVFPYLTADELEFLITGDIR